MVHLKPNKLHQKMQWVLALRGISSLCMIPMTDQKVHEILKISYWGYGLVHFLAITLMIKLYNSIKTTVNQELSQEKLKQTSQQTYNPPSLPHPPPTPPHPTQKKKKCFFEVTITFILVNIKNLNKTQIG